MSVDAAMVEYYRQRAPYYERVYHKPERQEDLRKLREMVAAAFSGKSVLDVACGTGYWTEIIAGPASSIVGIDFNEEVLEVARAKGLPGSKVKFLRGDAYRLPELSESFDAAMVGFWWSHVPKAKLRPFLMGLHNRLKPGATVMVFDNAFVDGSSTPISRKDSDANPVSHPDGDGNTYQERVLDDGSTHRIVKNFPSAQELQTAVHGIAEDVRTVFLTYYWILTYRVPAAGTERFKPA
jgi:demethylmenaquinone methyltransferase/2-methoxy-6-polyprenyl-1,4-benzoquinol methylase